MTTAADVSAKLGKAQELRTAVELAASDLGLATARVATQAALSQAGDDHEAELVARKEMREKQRAFNVALNELHAMLRDEIGRME